MKPDDEVRKATGKEEEGAATMTKGKEMLSSFGETP